MLKSGAGDLAVVAMCYDNFRLAKADGNVKLCCESAALANHAN